MLTQKLFEGDAAFLSRLLISSDVKRLPVVVQKTDAVRIVVLSVVDSLFKV